ncbi:MAG TPA: sialidase family protein [Thermoanaerobaculia bacterium]|jgi:hypothetical protein|nr:sialidase family protein [Thermoanaerobaculia bacterium]
MSRQAFLIPVALVLIAAAGSPANPPGWTPADPPAGPGAMAPSLTVAGVAGVAGKDVLLTWLEPLGPPKEPTGHQLRFARLSAGGWSKPATIASGPGFFANWADFPGVGQAPDGSLSAHWLAKMGDDTYAYGIYLARSADGGATWAKTGMLHDDNIPAEHGFVSWVAGPAGLRAFWLDGRETPKKGPMTLRTAMLDHGTPKTSELVDGRVCDCCQTDAALAADGPVVAFRDRTADEVRDIYVARWTATGWSKPVRAGADDWKIPGCPVNGPAIAASGKQVAVAWFTAAPPGPRVQLAVSSDGGATFAKPVLIDTGKPLGRVDLVLDGKDAVVSWMSLVGDNAVIRLRRVSAKGRMGNPVAIAATSAARGSGFPRLAVQAGRLHVAWVEEGDQGRRVRMGSLPLKSIGPG